MERLSALVWGWHRTVLVALAFLLTQTASIAQEPPCYGCEVHTPGWTVTSICYPTKVEACEVGPTQLGLGLVGQLNGRGCQLTRNGAYWDWRSFQPCTIITYTPSEPDPGPGGGGDTASTDVPPEPPEEEEENSCKAASFSSTDGMYAGNPIVPASGEKYQHELDYQDAGVHPLNLSRVYRSSPKALLGLTSQPVGRGWVHTYAGALELRSTTSARVVLPTGAIRVFSRPAAGASWQAQNSADTLVEAQDGYVYRQTLKETELRFDSAGKLVREIERNGWAKVYEYGADGKLTRVANNFGRHLHFHHDQAGRLARVDTPDESSVSYAYDPQSRLASVSFSDGTRRQYFYENSTYPAALTGVVDETGQRLASFEYDAQGRATVTRRGDAGAFTVTYGATSSDPVTVRDPLGTTRAYRYSTQNGKAGVREGSLPSGHGGRDAAARTFTAQGLIDSETDFLGVQTMYTWDINRQLRTSTTEAVGRVEARTTQVQWHPTLRLPAVVMRPGRTTAYTYDSLGNPLTETITDIATGQNRSWSWTYNAQGLTETMTDPRGGMWRYAYDGAGNRVSVQNPVGDETRFTFDNSGRVLTQTVPNGLVTRYAYDARGRLLTEQRGSETTAYGYSAHGLLASVRLPNGYQVNYSYDSAQRLTGATDSFGASIAFTLDATGNRVREQVKDAAGNIAFTTARTINSLNRVVAVTGAQGQATQVGYDANGEAISQTDPLGYATRQTLDALRRTTATTFPDNASATRAWGPLDQLTQLSDPKGVQTSYTYNAFGEVLSETSADIGTIRYTRDAGGKIVAKEDAKGQITRITRDPLGRPTVIEYGPGHTASFTYDSLGYIAEIQDRSGTTSYTRDTHGRILTKTQLVNDNPGNPSQFRVTYGYVNGELTSIQYPSGLKVTYQREAGRITGIDAQASGRAWHRPKPIVPLVSQLAYTALNQPKSWLWFNGGSASRSFDQDGRMVANEFASYTYNAAGRITGMTQQLWARGAARHGPTLTTTPLTWQIGYDSRSRLTSFTRDGAETRYTYDANSNRLTAFDKVTSDTDLDGEFDSEDFTQTTTQQLNVEGTSNRLLGMQQTITRQRDGRTRGSANTSVTYVVDANGAMTSDGLRTFEYDEANRLAKVRTTRHGEAVSVSYLSNAMSQRVFKSEALAEDAWPDERQLGEGGQPG